MVANDTALLDAAHGGRTAKTFFEILFYLIFGMPLIKASFQV